MLKSVLVKNEYIGSRSENIINHQSEKPVFDSSPVRNHKTHKKCQKRSLETHQVIKKSENA